MSGLTVVEDFVEPFKQSMRQWVSGVTVVTMVDAEGYPHGYTASSFTAISMVPPIVLVCLDRHADCYQAFAEAKWLAVNILGHDQRDVADRFARKGPGKFHGLITVPGLSGVPLIDGSVATLECSLMERSLVGDHLMLLSRVHRVGSSPGVPLVYHQRCYCGIVKPKLREIPEVRGEVTGHQMAGSMAWTQPANDRMAASLWACQARAATGSPWIPETG